jgi:hypothetical protein
MTFLLLRRRGGSAHPPSFVGEVLPTRIERLNQRDFLLTPPGFDFFLPGDSCAHVAIHFVEHEARDVVFLCEAAEDFLLVLGHASFDAARDPGIEDCQLASQDLYEVRLHVWPSFLHIMQS